VAKILEFLIWPVGMIIIVGVAWLLARRAVAAPAGPRLGRLPWLGYRPALDDAGGISPVQSALQQVGVFLAVIIVGGVVIFGIMALLGQLVLHGGPSIDKPLYHWTVTHRIHTWKGLMSSLTKIGNTWSTRMAVVSAAVCLAVTWRRFKWLPALAFLVLSLLQRYLTHGIHVVAHRVGPPGFAHGTFPSGGSERTVVFFGLIAYFLWREFSGRRVTAIWAGAAVAAVAFNEGYSRLYLGMHWSTDVLSGWFYGILLLALFILATRVVMGPARRPEELLAGDPAVVRAAGNTAPQPVGPAAQPARASSTPPPRPGAAPPPAQRPVMDGPR
jgi:membrane-associated phospholipid phosphatase